MGAMKNIPEIRIKGFEGEWKEKRLEDVAPLQRGFDLPTSQLEKGPYPVVYSNGIGYYHKYYKCKAPGLVTGRSGTIGHFTYIRDGYYWPHNTTLWVTDFKGNEPLFIEYLYKNKHFENFMMGSGVPTLNRNEVHKEHSAIPNLAEQQSLGSFFSSFDRLLSDHHRRLENLRRVKKSMLQKMFPQQGQTVPEIRFKGFSGEWKEMKLGDVGTIISGVGFPNKEQGGKHGIPFYKVSDMNNKGNETMMINANNYVTKQQIEKYHWKVCEDVPAIFFAKVGAAIFFDRKRLVTTPCLFDNNTMVYCLDKEFWDATFCLKLFEHIKLSSLSQVGSLPSFNGTAVENISVLIPSKAEQHLIGSFLTSLDNLINDEVNYIDQLTRVKSTLLQKMFV